MKKTIVKVLALAAILALPSQVLAAAVTIGEGSVLWPGGYTIPGSSLEVKPSSKVTLHVNSDASTYAVMGAHKTGDRVFGTSKAYNKIFWKDTASTDAGTYLGSNALTASSFPFDTTTGWSAY